jgi:hypothetical protein
LSHPPEKASLHNGLKRFSRYAGSSGQRSAPENEPETPENPNEPDALDGGTIEVRERDEAQGLGRAPFLRDDGVVPDQHLGVGLVEQGLDAVLLDPKLGRAEVGVIPMASTM